MPLVSIRYHYPIGTKLGLWTLSETKDELEHLSSNEGIKLPKNLPSHPYRRYQVIASHLILHKLGVDTHQIQKTPAGKPILKNDEGYISLAHSRKMAVAAYSPEVIGIDLEPMYDRDICALAPKFLAESERHYQNNAREVYKIWTAKEAVYKAFGGNVILRQHIFRINDNQYYIHKEGRDYYFTIQFHYFYSSSVFIYALAFLDDRVPK